ncbi:MAG: right-handed parallel beta-helix repeat-containing protein, partial [Clostridia bacterium]|nr:right-handed parallel beta-helix repeat-containing protein [Clostridia bacterium]
MEIRLSAYAPVADGSADCSAALHACFAEAAKHPGTVLTIEPGEYLVDSPDPIPLCSDLTVHAEGAVFRFPRVLGQHTQRRMFFGLNLHDVTWRGGHFVGYVFDPDRAENPWGPAVYTGCLHMHTDTSGVSRNIRVSDVTAQDVAGAVVHVRGREDQYCENVDVYNCRFLNCGKFMWDYGFLWQRVVFAHAYTARAVKNALQYLPAEHLSSELTLKDGRLYAEKMPAALPQERDAVTFFGETVPVGTKRGKQYFVLNKGAENGLLLSETEGGDPLVLTELAKGTRLFRNMFYIFHDLFAPVGSVAHQKGSIDTTKCRNVTVTGCHISASGDSMHILECENVVFANNQVLGARMGAFYIGFFCKNVTVTGNTVYGTNGSRTMSIERSTEDITIVGNIFRGGGRGSWFNQPKNLVLSDNVFIRNMGKCTPDIQSGRICQATGDFESYPEVYFTTWQPDAEYGPIVMRGNIIEADAGASAAV